MKRITLYYLVPFIFLSLAFCASLLLNSQYSFTILAYNENRDKNDTLHSERLLKNKKITGEFVAKENNLGIVSLRFALPPKVEFEDEDVLLFRIKEKGEKDWHYQNEYKTGILYGQALFPFGFPVIPDSSGKHYLFEVISRNGNTKNAVALSKKEPVLSTRYQFPKRQILTNKTMLLSFLEKKVVLSFSNIEFIQGAIIYFVPFFLYTYWLMLGSLLRERYASSSLFIITMIFISLLVLQESSTYISPLLLGLWILAAFWYRLECNISYLLAATFLIISIPFVIINYQETVNTVTSWAYLFLLVGVAQSLYEMKTHTKRLVRISDYLKNIPFLKKP